MPEAALQRIPTKNDKRKTVKAVRPLRFREILVPICRNMTSTCRVQSPHALMRIFLTGYPPILDIIYVNTTHFPYVKKSLQTENRFGRTFIFGMAKQPTKHCFFIWRASPYLWHYLKMCLSPIFSFLCLSLSASILDKTLPHAILIALSPQILPVRFSMILLPVHQGGLSARP